MNVRRYSLGTWVSGAGHLGLLTWLVAGWGMHNEPLPFEISEVSVISGEQYDALVQATSPSASVDEPSQLEAPEVVNDQPVPSAEAPAPDLPVEPAPAPTPPPVEETPPPPPAPPAPAEVTDTVEALPTPPAPPQAAPDLPPSTRPTPRPADRIASTPVAPPPPDAQVAPVDQQEVAPDAPIETAEAVEDQEAAAPEETATEIVTEDETPSGAVDSSPRPPVRPTRLAAAQRPEPAEQTAEAATAPARDAEADAIAAALAAASSSAPVSNAPSGPPLTGGEQDNFRRAISGCWVVDPGAEWARTAVTVAFSMGQDGRVQGDIRMTGFQGGDEGSARTAFEAARRAILRCQSSGYQLPAAKYDHWKEVEITFDPSSMRLMTLR